MMIQQTHSHKKFILPIIFLLIIAVSFAGWAVVQSSDLRNTQESLASAQNQLELVQEDLSKAEANLETTQANLAESQQDLTGARSELSIAQVELMQTQNNLTDALDQVTSTSEQLNTLQSEYDSLKINYDRMTTGYAYVLSDPTYEAMTSFLASDKTDQNTYNVNTYNCQNFCADVITNAAKVKIRCAFVSIDEKESGHAIIAFNTIDKGLVYIEPQNDDEVNLQVGKHYYQCVMPQPGFYYTKPSFDDTIVRFVVVW